MSPIVIEVARSLAVSLGLFAAFACGFVASEEIFIGSGRRRALTAFVALIGFAASGVVIRWGLS